MAKNERVKLFTTRIFTPYKKNEVFGLDPESAEKVIKESEGGVVKYDPKKHKTWQQEQAEANGEAADADEGDSEDTKSDAEGNTDKNAKAKK